MTIGSQRKVSEERVDRFAADLRAALRLQRQFNNRQVDIDRAAGHFADDEARPPEKIFYAVDSVILYMFLDPERKRIEDRKRHEEAPFAIFPGIGSKRNEDVNNTLSEVISHYIFNILSFNGDQREPLLLLPGHDFEARQFYDGLVKEFQQQQDVSKKIKAESPTISAEKRRELIACILDDVFNRKSSDLKSRQDEADVDNQIDKLHELIFRLADAHHNFHRFNRLVRRGALRKASSLRSLVEFSYLRDSDGSHAFDTNFTESEVLRVSLFRSDCERFLAPRIASPRLRKNDIDALVALKLINDRLRQKNARLALITANPHIVEFASGINFEKYDDVADSQYSFGDLYIRHANCFLSAPEIFVPSEASVDLKGFEAGHGIIQSWLNTLLAPFWKYRPPDNRRIAQLLASEGRSDDAVARTARQALRQNLFAHAKPLHMWVRHVNQIASAHMGVSSIARSEIFEELGSSFLEDKFDDGQFDRIVRSLTERSWIDFFKTATISGYELFQSGENWKPHTGQVVRPLVFFHSERAQSVAERLVALPPRTQSEYESLVELAKDVADHDETGYYSALCFGLLFAHSERWHVADLLAKRAFVIAKNPSAQQWVNESDRQIYGREALYFRTCIEKTFAKCERDLDRCEELLVQASELESLEGSLNVDGTVVALTGLRNQAESATLKLMRLCFRLFIDNQSATFEETDLATYAKDLFGELEDIIFHEIDKCALDWVSDNICQLSCGNYFILVALSDEFGFNRPDSDEMLRKVAAKFLAIRKIFAERNVIEPPLSYKDRLSSFYAIAKSGVDFVGRRSLERQANQFLHEFELRTPAPFMMPYDKKLFTVLKKRLSAAFNADNQH